jgi:hypothetical protein
MGLILGRGGSGLSTFFFHRAVAYGKALPPSVQKGRRMLCRRSRLSRTQKRGIIEVMIQNHRVKHRVFPGLCGILK